MTKFFIYAIVTFAVIIMSEGFTYVSRDYPELNLGRAEGIRGAAPASYYHKDMLEDFRPAIIKKLSEYKGEEVPIDTEIVAKTYQERLISFGHYFYIRATINGEDYLLEFIWILPYHSFLARVSPYVSDIPK